MCEHQFEVLVSQLTKEQQQLMLVCTFRDLIVNRHDLCALLIVSIVNSYLHDNASVSSISSKLRENCPSLYRNEDAVSHKATEILKLTKSCVDNEEREERLHTALALCKSAAPNLPLQNICQQFTAAGFYQGVIELTSTCASKIDPNETARASLHYSKSSENIEDQEGFLAYNARMECYKEVKMMLEQIFQKLCNANTNLDVINCGYIIDDREKNLKNQILQIINVALQSHDQLLHISIYEWLLAHNLLSELLGISETSLGEFLSKSVARTPENMQLADLLWKYYERNGQHSAAAKILDNLATLRYIIIQIILDE